MKQYLDLLQNIVNNGVEKESGRANMPNTLGISQATIKMDLSGGFPLLTTKHMYWKGIVHELLWFLRGDTNIKYLVDNQVNIWNGDAYRWYLKLHQERTGFDASLSMEAFISKIKEGDLEATSLSNPVLALKYGPYKLGDLGKVYGYQWRNQNGVDQVSEVLKSLKENPYSRYHIIDAWNKADFRDMALPPCHLLYQFIVRPLTHSQRCDLLYKEGMPSHVYANTTSKDLYDFDIPQYALDLNMYQRSCDTFLGVPFNLASMSLLLEIFAKASNMVPGIATWLGGDTHLYLDHLPMVYQQFERTPMNLPKMAITKDLINLDDIMALTITDFELTGYDPYGPIKAELFTGLKK